MSMLTTGELAKALGVSPRWVQQEVKQGGLPCHRLGSKRRLVRFDLTEVMDWVREQENKQGGPEERS